MRPAGTFSDDSASASSALVLDLDFSDDGTIRGRVDADASLLWPQPVAITGTWAPAGEITLELRDLQPAESWRSSPIARELRRTLVLTGTRSAAGLQGTLTESITGLRDAPVTASARRIPRGRNVARSISDATRRPSRVKSASQ